MSIILYSVFLFLLYLINMAFVFRQQRNIFNQTNNRQVGPGTYEINIQKQTRIPRAYIPFGSMQPRQKQLKNSQNLPGPGSYNIDKGNSLQKVVVSSATEDIKILQVAKPLSIFKSLTKRFQDIKQQTPGPGQYYKEVKRNLADNLSKLEDKKPKIIQHLIKLNKYQPIPSIPSNTHAYGYNQNQKNQLQLNDPPHDIHRGDKNNSVGPGHYNIIQSQKNKRIRGLSWQQPKMKTNQQIKQNLLGPGSYQIKQSNPVFNYKPSPQFASNTLRSMDQRRGAISKQWLKQKMYATQKSESQIDSKQNQIQSTNVDSEEDQEYIEDTTPGPGSYLKITQNRSTKYGKSSHLGSRSKRFQDKKTNTKQISPGPGEYLKNQINKDDYKVRRVRVPFGAKDPRFLDQTQVDIIPGPGSYQPRNALQDRLIFKIQRGYRGQFGTTQQRFKQTGQKKLGPGYYIYSQNDQYQDGIIQNAIFKSKTNKGSIFNLKQINPPPGAYQLNYYDISKNVIKQQEQDPDLVIKKPGFNIGAKRFKYDEKKQDPFQDDDILHQIQMKAQQQQKKKKNNAPFNSRQAKLNYKGKDIPGPGMYQIDDKWNHRTFNILFADI